MNVVLYLRMSTDKQDTSIPQQREALQRHADRNGYSIVGEYRDEGISGDATRKRKGFQQMLADATNGTFERILCFDQDRFGRFDMIEAGWWITPLRDAGITLETIGQGVIDWCDFAGRLTYAVAQEGKHQFLRDMSRNALRGQVARAKEGKGLCGGAAPYGYRRHTETEGRRRRAYLVIHEPEARVVRRIFETYAETGGSLLAVGQMLNRENIPSPNKRSAWHRNAVRRILRNETYAGDYIWGRTRSGRYHVRIGEEVVSRQVATALAVTDPIVHRDMIPAIVSRDVFDKAEELLAKRRKLTRAASSTRPLSGLIFCAKCGSPMYVNFGDYRCARSVDFGDGTRCKAEVARGDTLLDAIVDGLQKHLLTPKRMAAVKAQLAELVKGERLQASDVDPKALGREIDELERQIRAGIERIPLLPKSLVPELAKGLDALRAQRDGLEQQRKALATRKKPARLPIEKKIAECLAAAHGLREAVASKSPSQVNEALRNLGVRIYFDDTRATVRLIVPDSGTSAARAPAVWPAKKEKPRKSRARAKSPIRGTCNAPVAGRDESLEIEILRFTVEIPPHTRRPWGSCPPRPERRVKRAK